MKKTFCILLFILAFFAANSAQAAAVFILNQDNEFVQQTPNNPTPAKIGTMYEGDLYTFRIASDRDWVLSSEPTGLSFSVNNGAFQPDMAAGNQGVTSVTVQANANIEQVYNIVLSIIIEGLEYNYILEVLKKPPFSGKFTCPSVSTEINPGTSISYPSAVKLSVTGNPVTLTQGQILGTADNGKVWIQYAGTGLTVTTGEVNVPVIVFAANDATLGAHLVSLDKVANVESGCEWPVLVKAEDCKFTLHCSQVLITPNQFLAATSVNASVKINYTLTGCSKYTFNAVTVKSTGVEGLTLTLYKQEVNSPSGSIVGVITGTPEDIGTATFNIPGYCSFSVKVEGPKDCGILKISCCMPCIKVCCTKSNVNKTVYLKYKLYSTQNKVILKWSGASNPVCGLYAEVPLQSLKPTKGCIYGNLTVNIKGKPTRSGCFKVPVKIENKTYYVSVLVAKNKCYYTVCKF